MTEPTYFRPELLTLWNNRNYPIEFVGSNLAAIILGETHGDDDSEHKQAELIKAAKPEYILHEAAAAWMYDPAKDGWSPQPHRKISSDDLEIGPDIPPKILRVAQQLGAQVIGCDLSYGESVAAARRLARLKPDGYEFDEDTQVILKKDDPDWFFYPMSDEAMTYRDEKMAKVVKQYQAMSRRSLVVVLGGMHARNIHSQGLIQSEDFGYAYVDQAKWLSEGKVGS